MNITKSKILGYCIGRGFCCTYAYNDVSNKWFSNIDKSTSYESTEKAIIVLDRIKEKWKTAEIYEIVQYPNGKVSVGTLGGLSSRIETIKLSS